MNAYEEIIARIKEAYLSIKNIDSVYEQLIFELKNEGIDVMRMYTPKFLRNFMEKMMRYLFQDAYPKMKTENFVKDPKKTIVLLNAIAIQRVIHQVKSQIKSMPRVGITPLHDVLSQTSTPPSRVIPVPPRTLPNMSVPISPITKTEIVSPNVRNLKTLYLQNQTQYPQYSQDQTRYVQTMPPPQYQYGMKSSQLRQNPQLTSSSALSTSLDVLFPKKKKIKKATSLRVLNKVLMKGEFEEHEWWKKRDYDDDNDAVSDRDAHENPNRNMSSAPYQEHDQQSVRMPQYPWKLITIASIDRDMEKYPEPSNYIYPIDLDGVISINLHFIDITLEGNVITEANDTLYYSEDDDNMKTVKLKKSIHIIDLRSCEEFLDYIAGEMTAQSSKYTYKITLNRHTNRIKISQNLESGQARNCLHLYFEQTRGNCAEIFGFEPRDYRDCSEYIGPNEHGLLNHEKEVHMKILELSSEPLLTLKMGLGKQRSQQHFNDACIYHSSDMYGDKLKTMTILFTDTEGSPVQIGKNDHTMVLKYNYVPVPSRESVKKQEQMFIENESIDTMSFENTSENEFKLETISNTKIGEECLKSETLHHQQETNFSEPSRILQDIRETREKDCTTAVPVQYSPPPKPQKVTIKRLPTLDI